MNIILWIIAAVLAVAVIVSGGLKLSRPKDALVGLGMEALEPLPPRMIKILGGLEVAAALGLVLPAVTGVAPILVPLAALGIVLIMIGAVTAHARRNELPMVAVTAALLLLAAVVVWGRFGPYAFTP